MNAKTRQTMKSSVVSSAIVLFLSLAARPASAQTITHQITLPSGMSWCDDSTINGLFSQINLFRSQNGVPPLNNSALGQQGAELRATQFAIYMQTNNSSTPVFNSHTGYDTTAASIGYNIVGEDLAYQQSDPSSIVHEMGQDPSAVGTMLTTSANVAGVSCVYYNGVPFSTYEPGACRGAACSAASPTPTPTPAAATPTATPTLDSEEWTFLTLINNFRAANGLGALQVDVDLENAALWMSNDLAANNYFSHTDSLGRSTGARLAAFNYPYIPWGEDLAAGYSDAQDAFTQWETACDPDASGACTYEHRQIMLGPFTVIGVARASSASSRYGWYWTTDYGAYVDQIISPTTPPSAPTIVAFTATPSSITAGQTTTLSWSVSGATAVTISNGVGTFSGADSVPVSPAQTTTYTLTASNNSGSNTALTTVMVTPAKDTAPPTVPVLNSAVAKSSSEVDLVWTVSTDNVGVAAYQIVRNGSAIDSVSGTTLSYADTGLTPSTIYSYAVRAFDTAGNYSALSNTLQATTNAAAVTGQVCPSPATGVFTGCYYPNTTLSGSPVLVRTDSQISFDWGSGSPDSTLTPHSFSVRWEGYFSFSAGSYIFSATTSDGMRVYVDGTIVLNQWIDQPATQYTFPQALTQGAHLITVEYYDHTGSSSVHLTWQAVAAASQLPVILSFRASPPAVVWRQVSSLTWNVDGATSLSIDNGVGDVSNTPSIRVSPRQTTTYTLTASNSAGSTTAQVVLTVGSVSATPPPTAPILVSAVATGSTEVDLTWSASSDNGGVAGYQVSRNGLVLGSVGGATLAYADRTAGSNTTYTYTVTAYDAAGNYSSPSNSLQATTPAATGGPAAAGSCPAPAVGAFTGCYYNNLTLAGDPVFTRTDDQISFGWGSGSPDASVTPGNFSVSWQGYFPFNDGIYGFTLVTSDGMRIYIDGKLILDAWQDQPLFMFQARPMLTQGTHLITVQYYEDTGSAIARLTWQQY